MSKDYITDDIKLLYGDCLERLKEIHDGSIDMILTDPPYGTTACKWDTIIPFEEMWRELNRVVKTNGVVVLFGSEPFSSALRMSNIKNYKYDWVWVKENGTGFLNAKKQPLRNNELIHIFYRKQCLYNPQMRKGFKPYSIKSGRKTDNYREYNSVETKSDGERYPLNTLYFSRDKGKMHPTQKPVDLLEYLIKTYTLENETVLDFTAGSMSTAIACINTNRKGIMIEKDEHYFNVGSDRVAQTLRQLENNI